MSFKRNGTAEPIEIIGGYDKQSESDVMCPECGKKLNFKSSGSIIRQGSKLIIGKVIVKCSSCGKTVQI